MTKKGYKQTKEHTKLLSKRMLGNQFTKGRKYPKDKYPNFGWRKYHKEHINNIGENHPLFGKHLTEETIQKMKKPKSEEHKKNIRIGRFEYIKFTRGIKYPCIGKYETQILDALENRLGFNIKRQFYVCGYWLDGYCIALNLAIEVDEHHHYKNNILNKKDIDKQTRILQTLNCNFLRIKVDEVVEDKQLNISKMYNVLKEKNIQFKREGI